jgi:heme-degrading monooxygenase HmoA
LNEGDTRRETQMIVRTWRCQATAEQADAYAKYLTGTVFASVERLAGHRGAYLLRREVEGQVEFLAVTFWDSVEAIKEYAGETIDTAVVKPEAQAMLSAFDSFVHHYALVHDTVGRLG